MFTGIVETLGEVAGIVPEGSNITFRIRSSITQELKVDQSVSHNGVCLTVTDIHSDTYAVTAVEETLQKSNLGTLRTGDLVNLERCMPAHGRFDGHIVQGHVDQTAVCTLIDERDGSWLFDFDFDQHSGNINVEKGAICVNGISLTVFNVDEGRFRVAVIPYTYRFTNLHFLKPGAVVNLEFDIVGKYIRQMMKHRL